jgi:hypothetical protein
VLLIVASLVLGVVIGLALGGSLQKLSEVHFRAWPLALVGLVLQIVPISMKGQSGHLLAVGLLVASYAVLVLFVALNLRLAGFWVVGLGFALNLLVILVNGGMPVSRHALAVAYGPGYQTTFRELTTNGGAKHHLARPDDVLLPLSDLIPIGKPVGNVFSAGDMVSLVGIAWVLAAATKSGSGESRIAGSDGTATPTPPASADARPLEQAVPRAVKVQLPEDPRR